MEQIGYSKWKEVLKRSVNTLEDKYVLRYTRTKVYAS